MIFSCHPRPDRTRGSALLAALCFAAVLALALVSYAGLCYSSLKSSARALQSTRSVELAESGLEDALWALNNNTPNSTSAWTTTGWNSAPSGGVAIKQSGVMTFENGSTGQIQIKLRNYPGNSTTPVTITSWGIVTSSDGSTMIRALTSNAPFVPVFVNAVGTTSGPVVFANGGSADSYDSSDHTKSTNGDYDPTKAGFSAIIASGVPPPPNLLAPPVQLTNTQLNGYVLSISGAAAPSYDSSTTIRANAGQTMPVDPGQLMTFPNSKQPLFAENLPASGSGEPIPSTLGVSGDTTPQVYIASGDINLTSSSDSITVNGPVTLVVPGDFSISGDASITLAPGGSLALHVAGNLAIDGGGIYNQTFDPVKVDPDTGLPLQYLPKRLAIFNTSTASNLTFEMGTATPFRGVIYVPNSDFVVNGNQSILGSVVAKSVTFNATTQFHYDLSLRKPNPNDPLDAAASGIKGSTAANAPYPYTVTSWSELSPAPALP